MTGTRVGWHAVGTAVLLAGLLVCLGACDLPFDLGKPTTRSLESGVTEGLGPSARFTLQGTYTGSGQQWRVGATFIRPDREDISVTGADGQVEAIIIGGQAYFRGQAFLARHLGADPQSQQLVRAAGNAWWKGSSALAPTLPDLTTATAFRSTFLGAAVTSRTDNVGIDGVLTVELSGPRADVFVAQDQPHRLVHLRMKPGVQIDGLTGADMRYASFNDPKLEVQPPADVIDFSNLTTLPPIYTVVSVDTSRCGSPCVASALVKNLGGMNGAKAPSTVTFKLTSNGGQLGSCQVQVTPDVGYNATATVSCSITYSGQLDTAATVTATADNPGHV